MDSVNIIAKAKQYLKSKPIDFAHGFEHHRAVAKNCREIIQAEHLQINTQAVIIAAWWHDVESRKGTTDLLEREMRIAHLDHQTSEAIIAIIRSHTYGSNPETTEAKVLFDADKMEYFNPRRLKAVLQDAQKGVLPVSALATYYHNWLDRHKTILDSFSFHYSRNKANHNLAVTRKEIEKIRIFLEVTEKLLK